MKKALVVTGVLLLLVGCAGTQAIQKTQLQIREFQTRTYDAKDTGLVVKAILNVLQDDGYIVKNVVRDVGFISAEKRDSIKDEDVDFFDWLGAFGTNTYSTAFVYECTVNITTTKDKARVRVNFQKTRMNNKGGIREATQIDNEKFYQEFFAKVDKGVYLQKEGL